MAERTSLVRLEEEFDIAVDWRGFELHPETPAGGVPLSRLFPASPTKERRQHMRDFAAAFGIADMASPEIVPNTRRALAMAEYAREMGKLDAFRTLAMQARWKDDRDLEDESVLGELAAAAGLDPQKAVAAGYSADYLTRVDSIRAEAERMGITGIPAFIIGKVRIVGCQPYQILADSVLKAGGSVRNPA
ncbi:MAG: DsbA family protein [Chloroflexi bacterium]|nr:DsbA family protein [Chloroflexota bacterium]